MIDIESIFRYKIPDKGKLLAGGFTYSDGVYAKDIFIMKKQFIVRISVTDNETVNYKVYETETKDEYVLVHVEGAIGGFVGDVRAACEKVLIDISNKCFNIEVLKAEQTKKIIEFVKNSYNAEPEFLWESSPDYAVFRISENRKWFGVIMTVDRSKIGLPGHGNVEILVLNDKAENVAQRVDGKHFFKAYHMNKKYWYAVCLDGRVPDEEVQNLIDISYELSAKKK